ncbi:MAG: hypothetical protein ACLSHC_11165 [Bilophila wadsworthia]
MALGPAEMNFHHGRFMKLENDIAQHLEQGEFLALATIIDRSAPPAPCGRADAGHAGLVRDGPSRRVRSNRTCWRRACPSARAEPPA